MHAISETWNWCTVSHIIVTSRQVSWLIFCVALSSRIDLDLLVVTASPARDRLENWQLTDGGMPPTYDSMHKSELSVENWILRYAIHRLYHFRLLVDAEWIRSQL